MTSTPTLELFTAEASLVAAQPIWSETVCAELCAEAPHTPVALTIELDVEVLRGALRASRSAIALVAQGNVIDATELFLRGCDDGPEIA